MAATGGALIIKDVSLQPDFGREGCAYFQVANRSALEC